MNPGVVTLTSVRLEIVPELVGSATALPFALPFCFYVRTDPLIKPYHTTQPLNLSYQLSLHAIMNAADLEGQGKEIASHEVENVDAIGAISFTDEEEKALVKKIDLTLLPTIWVMYLLSYLDRTK